MVWYNLLHVVSALGRIDRVASVPHFAEMVDVLRSKLDEDGCAKPESIYMIYKGEEWSNKKAPGRLMIVLVQRALTRRPRRRGASPAPAPCALRDPRRGETRNARASRGSRLDGRG